MKKVLQFSGLIAAVIAVVAFVLLLATPGIYANGVISVNIDGNAVLFGSTKTFGSWSVNTNKGAVIALIAWILIIIAFLGLVFGFILPMVKKDLSKAAGMLNLCAAICLIVAGIMLFFTLPSFASANGWENTDNCGLGAGWVVAAILAIVAGACALCPTIANFVGKKK